jgi:hypothetical protein
MYIYKVVFGESANMEAWRNVWRNGFAPNFTSDGLLALRQALESDDCQVTQSATTVPAARPEMMDWPAEGACAITYCGWHGEHLETVGELDEFFSRVCFEADLLLGESGAARWFLNWYDEVPRDEMRWSLLEEIDRELGHRLIHVERGNERPTLALVGTAA